MSKLEVNKKKVCDAIMGMSPNDFYDLCSEIEASGNPFNFEIFDCPSCHEMYYADHLECGMDCVSCFMDYNEVKENEYVIK